ncbi:Xaa-Pro peptidase family protein [Streptomyces sp. NPDC002588]|uniref:Xaa-Pro peptidase family protein n=1 Tax=Streptomyces sp. NPDC002588 TaxID=3154419 RepID=UPI00331A3184
MTNTFSERTHAARMRRAARDAAAVGLSGLLLTPGPDLSWLSGHRPPVPGEEEPANPLTLLVLTPDATPRLLVPARDHPAALSSPAAGALRVSVWRDDQDPYAAAAALLLPHGHYGISDATWSVHLLGLQEALPLTTYRPLATALPLLRALKDEEETARLAAAAAAADAAYDDLLAVRFTGRREAELAADLTRLLRTHGHERVDVAGVACGPHGAHPRHRPGERRIGPGDTVVLDLGGRRDGYASALTRTVRAGGPPADGVLEAHTSVRAALRAAVGAVRPGVSGTEVERAARAAAGHHADALRLRAHGIGVTRHEPPYLTGDPGRPRTLLAGMCLTLGAGLLLPGRFGVRVGEVVACTADGVRRLGAAGDDLAPVA